MNIFRKITNYFFHAHFFAFSVFATLFTFFFFAGGFVVANGQTLAPSDSHIVNLYADGQTSYVPTRAATVGEFLQKAGVTLSMADKVEPSPSTPISQDNFNVQVFRAQPYTVTDGEMTVSIMSPETSLSLIAQKAGFKLNEADAITMSTPKNFVNQNILGSIVTIKRATAVNVILYGSAPVIYRTQAETVSDFMKEKGVKIVSGATISPSLSSLISANMLISVSQPGDSIVTEFQDVPFSVQSIPDPSKFVGSKNIITPGIAGKAQVIYIVKTVNGVISRTKISEVVSTQPVPQVEQDGTQLPVVTSQSVIEWMQQVGISPGDYYYVDFIINHEAGWNGVTKWNRGGSGAYGICQALPGGKMVSAGSDWATNPVTQLRWCNSYAIKRYGSWASAYNFWTINRWW